MQQITSEIEFHATVPVVRNDIEPTLAIAWRAACEVHAGQIEKKRNFKGEYHGRVSTETEEAIYTFATEQQRQIFETIYKNAIREILRRPAEQIPEFKASINGETITLAGINVDGSAESTTKVSLTGDSERGMSLVTALTNAYRDLLQRGGGNEQFTFSLDARWGGRGNGDATFVFQTVEQRKVFDEIAQGIIEQFANGEGPRVVARVTNSTARSYAQRTLGF